jgi:hypothetical protein
MLLKRELPGKTLPPYISKHDGIIHLAALGASGATNIGIVGVNVATFPAAKDSVLRLGWVETAAS